MFRSGLLSTRRLPYKTLSGDSTPLYRYNGMLEVMGHRGFGLFADLKTSGTDATSAQVFNQSNGDCCGTDSYGNPNNCNFYVVYPSTVVSSSLQDMRRRGIDYSFYTENLQGRYYGFKDIAAPTYPSFAIPDNGYKCTSPVNQGERTTAWNNTATCIASALAIKYDNTLWGWGDNSYGQLGDGTTTKRISPVQIGGSSDNNWKKVRSGGIHVLALKNDGTLWAWGYNSYGELGDGTTTSKSSPVSIGSDTWIDISAGWQYSLGIKSNGTMWAWGYNPYGNLGTNSYTNYSSPVQITSATDWISVYAHGEDSETSFAINSSRHLYGWGRNHNYQAAAIGTGNVISPNLINSSLSWQNVFLGNSTSANPYAGGICGYGITGDGKLWAWGKYPPGLNVSWTYLLTQVGANTRHLYLPYGGYPPLHTSKDAFGDLIGQAVITTEGYVSYYYVNSGSTRSITYSGKGGGGAFAITSNRAATYLLKTGDIR